MARYTTIARELSREKFSEIFSASSRKAREAYFSRHNVRKARRVSGLPRSGETKEARTAALHDLLQTREDDEMVEELLRTWLLTKRPLLAAALDHLDIPHQEGLTESDDVEKFTHLTPDELAALLGHLCQTAPAEDVAIYLKFMGAPGVDAAPTSA